MALLRPGCIANLLLPSFHQGTCGEYWTKMSTNLNIELSLPHHYLQSLDLHPSRVLKAYTLNMNSPQLIYAIAITGRGSSLRCPHPTLLSASTRYHPRDLHHFNRWNGKDGLVQSAAQL